MLTPELRDAIVAWLDAATAAIETWPLDPFDFSLDRGALDRRLSQRAAGAFPPDWSQASAEELHTLRQRVVDLRYQMELVEPLWPRFGRMWTDEAERLRDRLGRCQDLEVLKRLTAPHQPLAHWRSRLTPACTERTDRARAPRRAHRACGCSPKSPRRSATGWKRCGSTGGSLVIPDCRESGKSGSIFTIRGYGFRAPISFSPGMTRSDTQINLLHLLVALRARAAGPSSAMRPVCST